MPDRVEVELAKAREAADPDSRERALARADAILREHPEAPAAPFLRAEVLRAMGQWQEAHALDGGRLPGIGEKAVAPAPTVPIRVLTGSSATQVTIDGHAVTDVEPGEHAVVVSKDGHVVYATWLAVRGPLVVTLPTQDDACSLPAFWSVKRDGEHVSAPYATCGSWIAAAPTEHGVLVARCAGNACAPFVEWRNAPAYMAALPVPRDRSQSAIPAWAAWTAAGIGAVTALAVAIVATGVLEARPVEQRFVVGGARQE